MAYSYAEAKPAPLPMVGTNNLLQPKSSYRVHASVSASPACRVRSLEPNIVGICVFRTNAWVHESFNLVLDS